MSGLDQLHLNPSEILAPVFKLTAPYVAVLHIKFYLDVFFSKVV